MGAIIWLRRSLWDSLEEVIGSRAGLAISREEVLDLAGENEFRNALQGEDYELVRIRSDVYAEAFGNILHGIGAAEEPGSRSVGSLLLRELREHPFVKSNWDDFLVVDAVFVQLISLSKGARVSASYAETLLIEELGDFGRSILPQFMKAAETVIHKTPWLGCDEIEWTDIRKLSDLFNAETLGSFQDKFFDQRFINYLAQNTDSLQSIHWRQFEGLIAEYFSRHDLKVEVGPGRGDNNVDIRVWTDDGAKGPPAMIIQCKREARAISKVIVKSLYADLVAEGAQVGLVATTSQLSPGAREVCRTRSYPIFEANKDKVIDWLRIMRRPGKGILIS